MMGRKSPIALWEKKKKRKWEEEEQKKKEKKRTRENPRAESKTSQRKSEQRKIPLTKQENAKGLLTTKC